MIVPIGRWVLREACRQTKAWLDAGLSPIRLAVNISAVELRSKDFVESVKATLLETGFDPHYLELELTETDPAKAQSVAEEMARKLLANTVIESFRVDLVKAKF